MLSTCPLVCNQRIIPKVKIYFLRLNYCMQYNATAYHSMFVIKCSYVTMCVFVVYCFCVLI